MYFLFLLYEHIYKPIFIRIVPKYSDFFIVLDDIKQKYSGEGGMVKQLLKSVFFVFFFMIFIQSYLFVLHSRSCNLQYFQMALFTTDTLICFISTPIFEQSSACFAARQISA